jgi:hypothetical protein
MGFHNFCGAGRLGLIAGIDGMGRNFLKPASAVYLAGRFI